MRILILVFVATVIGLASGCATPPSSPSGPRFAGVENTPSDKALVYVYRPKRVVVGAYGWLEIFIDGKSLGKLRNANYAMESVSPGVHLFQYRFSRPLPGPVVVPTSALSEAASSDGPKVEFRLEAGKVYYIVYPAQKLVDESKALKDLKDCHAMK